MLLFWNLLSLLLVIRVAEAHIRDEDCPNYQYKCPDCPEGSECIYPDSGGCPGAGMPVCRSYNCNGVVCLIRALPCPEECPYSCQYTGPSCCPFIGQPECHTCETLVPCHETPCPDDCPDDCFYPDADHCCPKSGQPVCRHHKSSSIEPPAESSKTAEPSKTIDKREYFNMPPSKPSSRWFYQPEPENGKSVPLSWYHQSSVPPSSVPWYYQPTQSSYPPPRIPLDELIQEHSVAHASASKSKDWFYQPSALPTSQPWFYQPLQSSIATPVTEVSQAIGRIEQRCNYPCPDIHVPTWGSCIVHQEPHECCPWLSCVGEPLSVDSSVAYAHPSPTPTSQDNPIYCADYIIPCPSECPESCNYPQNVPCPYQHQPACPPVQPYITTSCVTTEIFSTPLVDLKWPTPVIDEPQYKTVTVTETETVTTSDPVVCPMVIYMCPPECPDTCIRPTNVPCPNAVPPHCPGVDPPKGVISVMPV
ncbi:hypothetical protein BJV82DRAFT_618992 [Fennellomyces sp. T-0311]|nr:hypothetical protein BJV82DRAFT_618992 [Fennellomyces sp. T-0311]